jgi:hypothetical protein
LLCSALASALAACNATPARAPCLVGQVRSSASARALDVFRETTFFTDGQPLAAGRYRVAYADGCMKYDASEGWATQPGVPDKGWFLVGEAGERLHALPGTMGHELGQGGFDDFEACVRANRETAPIEIEHSGGPLGLWLSDAPYDDNAAGLDGRNHTWRLERMDDCQP